MKLAVLALAIAPLAALVVTQSATPQIKTHVDKLQAAKTFTATLSIQQIGGSASEATLRIQKPNLFRYDSETRLVSTDGTTIWVLDKKSNSYTEEPATADAAAKAFGDEIWVWSAFFDAKFAEAIGTSKPGKARKMKGAGVKEVEVTFAKRPNVTATILLDDQLAIARGAVLHESKSGAVVDTIVFADKLDLAAPEAAASEFVFSPGRGQIKKEKSASTGLVWKDVELIFLGTCGACHGAQSPAAGLRLNSYENVMAGRGGRAIIVPGNTTASSVLHNIKGTSKLMPPGRKMPDATIAKVEQWIADGAKKE